MPPPGASPLPGASPPPGPRPSDAPCAPKAEHQLQLTGTYADYPLAVRVLAPDGNPVAGVQIPTPGAFGVISFPEGCRHRWEVVDAHAHVLRFANDFVVPAGAPYKLTIPGL